MIGRVWHGWTEPEAADAYEALLKTEILPGIHRVEGFHGTYLLRRQAGAEVEFVTLTLWESMDAVRAFAGTEVEAAVVPEAAQALLRRYDRTAAHYEVVGTPG